MYPQTHGVGLAQRGQGWGLTGARADDEIAVDLTDLDDMAVDLCVLDSIGLRPMHPLRIPTTVGERGGSPHPKPRDN